ncbi:hypothetical protein [Brevundimonas bacteroides]|uniref:hypothetical protein n=1 Tax=Brevundimonas bacteroides TaxID=74311 RepID=UPI0004957131|nr:hypothetical protein [Brevundimonas bacteroides]
MLLELIATAAVANSPQDFNGWPATVSLDCEGQAATRTVRRDGRWSFETTPPSPGRFSIVIDVANARIDDPNRPGGVVPVWVGYGVLRIDFPPNLLSDFQAPSHTYYLASPEAQTGQYLRTFADADGAFTEVGECRRR